jgi:hypothetical protein
MKQKDIALIIVVAFLSAIISLVLSGKIFVTPENRQQHVEVVDKISTEFNLPDSRYFNSNSVNPTVEAQLGTDTNQNPFNSPSQ